MNELKSALRALAKSPGFTAAAVATLALGIGANTAVFSVLNAVLLKPLPYPDPARLVVLSETTQDPAGSRSEVSYPNYADWRARSASLEGMAAWMTGSLVLTGEGEPLRLTAAFASADFVDVLGVPPAAGRFFRQDEDRPGAAPVAVIGYGLWLRRFGADPGILGRRLSLDGVPRTVVGVAPASLRLPSADPDVFLPLAPAIEPLRLRNIHVLSVLGRLRPNVPLPDARVEIHALAGRIERENPGADPGHGAAVVSLRESLAGPVSSTLAVLAGAVVLVLLIACANVACLLLARSVSRRKDVAIRTALGASRFRLARQWLAESAVLALAGGAAGVLLAAWTAALLSRFLPATGVPNPAVRLDARVLAFSLAVSLAAALLFSLAPLSATSRLDPFAALRGGGDAPSRRRALGRSALTVLQISVTMVLLAGSGLLLESLRRLAAVDPGFRAERVLTMSVSLPEVGYETESRVVGYYRALQASLASLPGVRSASAVSALPVSGGDGTGEVTVEGQALPPGSAPSASYRRALPGYFRTLGIPLLRGRDFDDRDDGRNLVVIVNAAMARRLWPGIDPIGHRIKVGPAQREPWLTVVGVVGDVRNVDLAAAPAMATYEPHAQRPWSTMQLALRTDADPSSVAASAGAAVRAAEKQALIENVQTMEARVDASLAGRRRFLDLLAVFAGIALTLATLGLAGLLTWNVAQRTREIGVRIALGARGRDVFSLVVGRGLAHAALGVVLGLGGSIAAGRLLASLLFQARPTDWTALCGASVLLMLVAGLASWLPARRAAAISPLEALRHE